MRFRVWGCRGSLASPGKDTVRYGGNTSCVEVRLGDGTLLILDAGSGIRPLGHSLDGDVPDTVHMLLTHLHNDHVQGLGFFSPLWHPDVKLHLWGPSSSMKSLEELIHSYLSPPLFPVHVAEQSLQLHFHDNPDGEWQIGSATVYAESVTHQGPTVGYRLEEDGQSLAYIPDHEPARGVDLSKRDPEWISGCSVARGVRFLLHDSQYFDDEYRQREGWGHSSVTQAVQFARVAEVEQLILFHHDPMHTDAHLEKLQDQAGELWRDSNAPILAFEGMEIDLAKTV